LLKAYKTEIKPNDEQKRIIHQTVGVCRFVYNFYLIHNKEVYEKEKRFVGGMDFSKWLNNEFLPDNQEYSWIKNVGSKAVKQSIMNGERAFKRLFEGKSKFPNFKKKNKSDVKAYFPKNNKTDWTVERHKIKVPTLGFIRLKEKGYIPTKAIVKSGTISMKAGRYYISVLVDEGIQENNKEPTQGIGIDLGLKEFAVCSNNLIKKNINKTKEVKKLEKKLKREQRCLSRKYEDLKKRNKNNKKGEATRQNIQKQVLTVQKLHQKLTNVRTNYINKTISEIVKQKPSFITIEDLNISGMMKNRHLSKTIAQQKFYEFRSKLTNKCKVLHIELRIVDRFYPSSKICHECGQINKDLKLSDRMYVCDCGYVEDRDYNASLNLRDAKTYKVA
jgi:putative transposase